MSDPHDLDRFLAAQQPAYERALEEVRQGRKRSHWMWFVFPQIAGLGHSAMAQRYAIADAAEARAYLAHPVLGTRLREITSALERLPAADAVAVFGSVDAMKLRSCLTLFGRIDKDGGGSPFHHALDRWFGGEEDAATLRRLGGCGAATLPDE